MTSPNSTTTGVPREDLVARIEADWSDASAWDDDPAPKGHQTPRLGASITLRLPPELAEEIRSIADLRGVAYTAMLREWLEERVAETRDLDHAVVFLGSGSLLMQPPATTLTWDSQEDLKAAL